MLKVRCDRSELTECLGDIPGIVPTAPAIKPILLNCHLRTSRGTSGDDESHQGESRLEIDVTDLAMAARIRLERAEVLEEVELALPASRCSHLRNAHVRSAIATLLAVPHASALSGGGARKRSMPTPTTSASVPAQNSATLSMDGYRPRVEPRRGFGPFLSLRSRSG